MGESETRSGNKQNTEKGKDQKNALEWIVFGLGLVLVLGVLGYWTYQVFKGAPAPPDLFVERTFAPSESSPNRYRVAVHNKGGQTAENVMVEVALKRNGQALDKAQLQIPYVPEGSKRMGWVNFDVAPARADTVVAGVVSYRSP